MKGDPGKGSREEKKTEKETAQDSEEPGSEESGNEEEKDLVQNLKLDSETESD